MIHSLEEKLLARGDQLIDMALARFGCNVDVVRELFLRENAPMGFRCACLSNPIVGPEDSLVRNGWMTPDIFRNVVLHGDDDALVALFSNPHLDDAAVCKLYRREEPFDVIPEDRWLLIVSISTGYWRGKTSEDYDPSNFLDGMDWHTANQPLSAAADLVTTAPAIKGWPRALHELFHALPDTWKFSNVDRETIARWNEAPNSDGLREFLAMFLSPLEDLKEDPDIAVRRAYYMRFRPSSREEVDALFEKDGGDFVNSALKNASMYRGMKMRHHFGDLVSKVDEYGFERREFRETRDRLIEEGVISEFDRHPDDEVDIRFATESEWRAYLASRFKQVDEQITSVERRFKETMTTAFFYILGAAGVFLIIQESCF